MGFSQFPIWVQGSAWRQAAEAPLETCSQIIQKTRDFSVGLPAQ